MAKTLKTARSNGLQPAAVDETKAPSAADEPVHEIIGYQIDEDDSAPIRPATRTRTWMDNATGGFPYRCLPLVIANQYGWEILSTHHVRATWDGTSHREGLRVENISGDGPLHCESHFGAGVLTFLIPFLFKTPEGWNLMVRGPTNNPKDGIAPLDGIVETDWSHATFTMNWRFTRAGTIEFVIGEPICLFFPIQRGALEKFRGEVRMLEKEPEFQAKFRAWSGERDDFLLALEREKPHAVAAGWQKDYMRAAKEKKPIAHPFVDQTSPPQIEKRQGNHEESKGE